MLKGLNRAAKVEHVALLGDNQILQDSAGAGQPQLELRQVCIFSFKTAIL